jgi:S-adenosylmethionine:tRNA ribosyltransferase-isomerase
MSKVFELSDLEYELPPELIAQRPLAQRDAARLLVFDRQTGAISDRTISELPLLLSPDDLIVFNDTRVIHARFTAQRRTGGRVDGLFLREERMGLWQVMLEHSARLNTGEALTVVESPRVSGEPEASPAVRLTLIEPLGEGVWRVAIDPQRPAGELLEAFGRTPLPPYIRRDSNNPTDESHDRLTYQTVFARTPGAVAAPTAGLHFTSELLDRIQGKGIDIAFVTLHVGIGTFAPIRADYLSEHHMHAEWYELTDETAVAVRQCRQRGGAVVAVGTTSVRVLESAAAAASGEEVVRPGSGLTDIFIYPPYRFRCVDRLLTNFHLPRSTLLALVMALAGREPILKAYAHAIRQRYRFYSYGDVMLIV